MPFLIITFLVTIHEVGHFLAAFFLKFHIDKIYFYPYGGISKFNLEMNVSLYKELIVLVMGPLFQLVGFFILLNIDFFNRYEIIIKNINYSILLFNFLPIYPLDGGKLLNILFCYKFSFLTSIKLVLIISYITIILLLLYFLHTSFSLNIIFMISFLLYKVRCESNRKYFYYDKFLLERYLYNYKFNNHIKVNSINDLYRDRSHIIRANNRYYTEKELLNKKFKGKC